MNQRRFPNESKRRGLNIEELAWRSWNGKAHLSEMQNLQCGVLGHCWTVIVQRFMFNISIFERLPFTRSSILVPKRLTGWIANILWCGGFSINREDGAIHSDVQSTNSLSQASWSYLSCLVGLTSCKFVQTRLGTSLLAPVKLPAEFIEVLPNRLSCEGPCTQELWFSPVRSANKCEKPFPHWCVFDVFSRCLQTNGFEVHCFRIRDLHKSDQRVRLVLLRRNFWLSNKSQRSSWTKHL